MGSSCTSLIQHDNRYQRARTRSRAHTATIDGDDGFPQPIDIDQKYSFSLEEGVLEEGATGRVIKGFEKNNRNHQVAIKIMPRSSDHGHATAQSLFENEVNILTRIKHPNIVQLLDVAHDDNNYYIVLSLAKGGDLVEYLFDADIHITEYQASKWVATMLETLQYLHSQNIAHCDIKPENIVFKSHRGDSEILIIDFGLAKTVNDESIYSDLCANRFYTAPEIAQHYLHLPGIPLSGKVWKSTDIWAVGVVAYIMVLNTLPFFSRTDKGIFQSIVNDKLKLPKIDSERHSISMHFRDFIQNILHKNPKKRLTIRQALTHPWIKRNYNSPSDIDIKVNSKAQLQENITFVQNSPTDEYGSLDHSENSDDSEHITQLQNNWKDARLKHLIHGYIRAIDTMEHKRKLTVLDGNLYFNCELKSQEVNNHTWDEIPIPSRVIGTIYDILFSFNEQIVNDDRTHTI